MNEHDEKLHNLMYGLLYPAILGAGIALLVTYGIQVGRQDSFYIQRYSLGVITLLIFCVSYGNTYGLGKYPLSAFLLDVLEIICMGICFWALGLFYKDIGGPVKVLWFSISLGFTLLVIQSVWLNRVDKKALKSWHIAPRVMAVLVIVAGSLCNCTWGVLAESAALLVVLGVYVRKNW